jgi:hypothetical protein
MTIVEQLVQPGKGDLSSCEDALVVTSHYAAVIDGASCKTERRYEGLTPGRMAVRLLSNGIETLREGADLPEALKHLTASIRTYYEAHDLLQRVKELPHERITASVAIFSRARRQVWMIGDCMCLVDTEYYTNPILVDEILAQTRALFLELELLNGTSVDELMRNDPGRAFLMPLLVRQMALQNAPPGTPFAYSVLNGFDVPIQRVKVIDVPHDAKTLVLGTDGYPQLYPTLAETEAALRKVLAQDPLCIRDHPSTKGLYEGNASFDDRAYLRLRLDG